MTFTPRKCIHVLKISLVYLQYKNYIPRVFLEHEYFIYHGYFQNKKWYTTDIFRTKNDIPRIFSEQKMIYHGYLRTWMHFLQVNVTFYDAVNMIHDVIKRGNPVSNTAKFMFVGVRNKNKRAMMALYRSTGWYVKSIHTKHYITWELV